MNNYFHSSERCLRALIFIAIHLANNHSAVTIMHGLGDLLQLVWDSGHYKRGDLAANIVDTVHIIIMPL